MEKEIMACSKLRKKKKKKKLKKREEEKRIKNRVTFDHTI
jgi:hypothetical protein